MQRVPVYAPDQGTSDTVTPDEPPDSGFHSLTFGNAYYSSAASGSAFHTTSVNSGYIDDRKYLGGMSVTDSVAGTSGTIGRQMHHLQPASTSTETDDNGHYVDSYFVDRPGEDVVIESMDAHHHHDHEQPNKTLFELEEERRVRHAENSRLRYHRMSEEQRRAVNQRRAERIKKQRQREREMVELENILKSSHDIDEEPEVQEILRQRRIKQRRADAARSRYHRMTEDQRREYNMRRRMRQLGLDPDCPVIDDDKVRTKIQEMNRKKAEAARARYHAMSENDRREYNARRTAAFRKRRYEEEVLLSTPAGKISAAALERAQKIMIRNAKKAESARLRYQRMSQDERREYNQRRAIAKKQRDPRSRSIGRDTSLPLVSSELSLSDGAISPGGIDPVTVESIPTETANKSSSLLTDDSVTVDMETINEAHRQIDHKTKQAQALLQGRTRDDLSMNITQTEKYLVNPNELVVVYVTTEQVVDASGKETIYLQPAAGQKINDKQLQMMLSTGRDERGRTVEIRTIDGNVLTPHLRADESGQPQITLEPIPKGYLQIDPYGELVVEDSGRGTDVMSQQHKAEVARKRRAEKARLRYHSMTPTEKADFNSKRAEGLRKARRRDEELVQLAEHTPLTSLDDETKRAVLDAQRRRQRRAMLAREKYHRMNSEERRQYNAMRDAQRRQRKRELENRMIGQKVDGSSGDAAQDGGETSQDNTHVDVDDSNEPRVSNQQMAYASYEMSFQDDPY
ncbi:unnamed protein product, partial [Mesorhabditis belari]|uniref:Uncharacterized protein n=1 Tax=Mesorhabditis belari TaxID=2138241 RepID=A0AAF3J1I2_9BILA